MSPYPQHEPIDQSCPWVGPCQCYRDAAICNCGHNNGRHADTGAGPCACGCPTFTPATLTDRAHAHGICLDHTPDECETE